MSVNRKFSAITGDDLLAVADRFGVRRAQAALSDVREAVHNWSEFAGKAALPAWVKDRVAADFLPL